MKNKEIFQLVFITIFVMVVGLGINVYLHEAAHFAAADMLGMNPETHYEAPVNYDSQTQVFSVNPSLAYVSYDSSGAGVTSSDAFIAAFGPLANALLAILFSVLFFKVTKTNKDWRISLMLLGFATLSVFSALLNLMPLPASDGELLLVYFGLI